MEIEKPLDDREDFGEGENVDEEDDMVGGWGVDEEEDVIGGWGVDKEDIMIGGWGVDEVLKRQHSVQKNYGLFKMGVWMYWTGMLDWTTGLYSFGGSRLVHTGE